MREIAKCVKKECLTNVLVHLAKVHLRVLSWERSERDETGKVLNININLLFAQSFLDYEQSATGWLTIAWNFLSASAFLRSSLEGNPAAF